MSISSQSGVNHQFAPSYDLFGPVSNRAAFAVNHEKLVNETDFKNPGVLPLSLAQRFEIKGEIEEKIFANLFSAPTTNKKLLLSRQAEIRHLQYIDTICIEGGMSDTASSLHETESALQVATQFVTIESALNQEIRVHGDETTYLNLILKADPADLNKRLDGWMKDLSGIRTQMEDHTFQWPEDHLDSILLIIALRMTNQQSLVDAAEAINDFGTPTTRRIGSEIHQCVEAHKDLTPESYLGMVLSKDREALNTLHRSFKATEHTIREGIVLTRVATTLNSPDWCDARYVEDGAQRYKQAWNVHRELESRITDWGFDSETYGKSVTVKQNRYDSPQNSRIRIFTGGQASGKTFFLETEDGLQLCSQVLGIAPAEEADVVLYDFYGSFPRGQGDVREGRSAYGGEIKNINSVVETVKNLKPKQRAKIALDEIGSTTDPHEGGALAAAVLLFLAERNVTVTCSTHYDALKTRMKGDDQTLFYHINVVKSEDGSVARTIEEGVGDSKAVEASKTTELQPSIIERAEQILAGQSPVITNESTAVEFVDYDPSARKALINNADQGWKGFFPEVRSKHDPGVMERWGFYTNDSTLRSSTTFFSVDGSQHARELAEKLVMGPGPASPQEWFERRRLFAELTDNDGEKYHKLTKTQAALYNLMDASRYLDPKVLTTWFDKLCHSFFEYTFSSYKELDQDAIPKSRQLSALAVALFPDAKELETLTEVLDKIEALESLRKSYWEDVRDDSKYNRWHQEFTELHGTEAENDIWVAFFDGKLNESTDNFMRQLAEITGIPFKASEKDTRSESRSEFSDLLKEEKNRYIEEYRSTVLNVARSRSHNGLDLTKEIVDEKLTPFINGLSVYPSFGELSGLDFAILCRALVSREDVFNNYVAALQDIDSIYTKRCALQYRRNGSPLPHGIKSGSDLEKYIRDSWVDPAEAEDSIFSQKRYRAPELQEGGMKVFKGQVVALGAVQLIARQIMAQNFCKGEPSRDSSIEFIGTFTPGFDRIFNSNSTRKEATEVRGKFVLGETHRVAMSTGPNMVGKTLDLTRNFIGIKWFMNTGFAPAESASAPFISYSFFVDRNREKIRAELSAFTNDCAVTGIATEQASKVRGEVVAFFDEPWSSTSEGYQAAFVGGLAQDYSARGWRTVMSLHHHEIINALEAHNPTGVYVYHLGMTGLDEGEIEFTREHQKGHAPSCAFHVAKKLGLDAEILRRLVG